jgi:DNA repair protein RecO (recombination protein O)
MSRTYKATGINLKAVPLGETDRILTILTKEHGLIRAVAMGARKANSKLGGRSGLFVVNHLLLAKGKSLDKITQAETLESYPGLGRNLKKLTAGQYLAEMVLNQALSEQPQEDLFYLFNEHLERIERSPEAEVVARLTHAAFQLLAIAGIAPQVQQCCVTGSRIDPDVHNLNWQAGFSATAGGTVTVEALGQGQLSPRVQSPARQYTVNSAPTVVKSAPPVSANPVKLGVTLTAIEVSLLQHLAEAELPQPCVPLPEQRQVWLTLERVLRQYAEYHFDRPIRSAALIDSCFLSDLSEKPSEKP